jgi:hypothetical protein
VKLAVGTAPGFAPFDDARAANRLADGHARSAWRTSTAATRVGECGRTAEP